MIDIQCCPSCLDEGYTTYCPNAIKSLFGGVKVSPYLDFELENVRNRQTIIDAMHRISVSGVQEKFPAIIDSGHIRIAEDNEQSTYILKPAPWDETLRERKQIPANEHLTMQIAFRVYGIDTAANGLCFTKKGQMVYITKRFDVLPNGTKLLMEDFASVIGKMRGKREKNSNTVVAMRILQLQSEKCFCVDG